MFAHAHVCMHRTECMYMGMYAHVLACIHARVCVCVCVPCVLVCRGKRTQIVWKSLRTLSMPPARHWSLPLPTEQSPWGKFLDIWAKERRNEITARFAACYLFLLKINDTIERFHSILLKQYPLQGSQEGEGSRGQRGRGSLGEARRLGLARAAASSRAPSIK